MYRVKQKVLKPFKMIAPLYIPFSLTRCVWHPQAMRTTQRPAVVPEVRAAETAGHSPQKESQILPRIKLSADIMQRLQALSGRMAPHLRPSIG